MSYSSENTTEASATGTWEIGARIDDPDPGDSNPLAFHFVMTIPTTNEYAPSALGLAEIDDLAQAVIDFLADRYPTGTVSGTKTYQASRDLTVTP